MAIERAAALKNAEKLLRQGKLNLAIEEYLRVVEAEPRDWNTANVLGDLYARAGKVDKAVEQFIRIADSLNDEGFLSKAGALYKKVLKIKPDHEHALLQAAEIAASQGLLADARSYLNTVLDLRRGRGDDRGVSQIRIRLGSIDPEDLDARMTAATARLQIKDEKGALRDFKELAAEYAANGRQEQAIDALRRAAAIDAQDPEIREQMLEVHLAAGDFAKARQCASTADQFKALAARLDGLNQPGEAVEALREASRLDPSDADLKAHLARTFVASGDMKRAAEYLTVETAGNDPKLLMTVAEIHVASGQIEQGVSIIRRLLAEDSSRRQAVAMLGWSMAERAPEAGFQVVEIAAESAVAQDDWPSAAAALQEFVTRVPNHIPALMRLVEICVDGGLEATMYSAQAHLADAYITAGMAPEARFIAEDLVAREPWERANVERFRKTLVLMGETDPDAIIAERLSGESPFTSTDVTLSADEFGDLSTPGRQPTPEAQKEFRSSAIDLGSAPGEMEPLPTAHGHFESEEVDLSIALDDIEASPGATQPGSASAVSLDDHFSGLRQDASRNDALAAAEQDYKRAMQLHKAGKIDECIEPLKSASRAPRLRFQAASMLGRIARNRKNVQEAIDWFERAAEVPAPSVDEGHQLLYELADALESVGETARALGVFMELQADTAAYRDVGKRVDRLSKAQARG